MKHLYQKKNIELIIQENPLVFITSCKKNILENIKDVGFKKFKNLILHKYNINIFNCVSFLIFGNNTILNIIKEQKINILGFFLYKNGLIYILSFRKFKIINIYKNLSKYKPLFEILNGKFY